MRAYFPLGQHPQLMHIGFGPFLRPWDRHFTFALSPGGERANLILSKRARLRSASGVRLSRVAIAAVLSPAAPIDRSSPSFSGVHGGPGALISLPSARPVEPHRSTADPAFREAGRRSPFQDPAG